MRKFTVNKKKYRSRTKAPEADYQMALNWKEKGKLNIFNRKLLRSSESDLMPFPEVAKLKALKLMPNN